jgi:large subunit ribosomal protein L31
MWQNNVAIPGCFHYNQRPEMKQGSTMKADIHPAYHEINVTCSCGNTFTTQSTLKGDLHIEVCSLCHPFYSGKQKILDTAGRVDKFNRKYSM